MEQIFTLTTQKAQRLFKKHREMCLPGSGIVEFRQGNIDLYNQYLNIVSCSVEDIVRKRAFEILPQHLHITYEVQSKDSQSFKTFQQLYRETLKKIFQSNEARRVALTLIYSQQNHEELLKIIRFAQSQEHPVFVKLSNQFKDIQQYQRFLSIFSFNIIENQGILPSAISVILSLPQLQQYSLEEYPTILLTIWKRTLPLSLGSIILEDWTDKRSKTVFKFHFQTSISPCWLLQFKTSQHDNAQHLGCECMGID